MFIISSLTSFSFQMDFRGIPRLRAASRFDHESASDGIDMRVDRPLGLACARRAGSLMRYYLPVNDSSGRCRRFTGPIYCFTYFPTTFMPCLVQHRADRASNTFHDLSELLHISHSVWLTYKLSEVNAAHGKMNIFGLLLWFFLFFFDSVSISRIENKAITITDNGERTIYWKYFVSGEKWNCGEIRMNTK